MLHEISPDSDLLGFGVGAPRYQTKPRLAGVVAKKFQKSFSRPATFWCGSWGTGDPQASLGMGRVQIPYTEGCSPMPAYCEVALPVPLDHTFTYAVRMGQHVARGMRVIVPFRNEKL